jgi:hypothetical protein
MIPQRQERHERVWMHLVAMLLLAAANGFSATVSPLFSRGYTETLQRLRLHDHLRVGLRAVLSQTHHGRRAASLILAQERE